ncbi:TolB-like protein [Algoriphagus ratkowskyi]|uniref:TolB-like protein n=1 Tax=Algoriphagus ratkowskyi TaxID=57028 RepID=A0A2W7RMC6_9BACT|nr:BF3164 family lipoprotein [Algoriphagus ratkowskyi]PZX60136.1 TolB-like protein [Algoriphagus ratkowskyi]TXD75679.1 hypothetical protein ESW18_19705 [Algoriphagus ratkowskyi]
MNKISLFIIISLVISCTNKQKEEFIQTQLLKNGKFLNSSHRINRLLDIHFIGNKYLINDPDGNYQFKIFDINNPEYELKIAKTGEGPCEFSFPTFSQILPNDTSTIGLYNSRLFMYREIKLLEDDYYCTSKEKQRIANNFYRVIKANDTILFGTGMFQKKYAVEYENLAEYQQLDINYPFTDPSSEVENFSITMSQQGQLFLRPDGKYILTTSQFSPTFDILEITKKDIKLKYRFEGWPPQFSGSDNPNVITASMSDSNKFGYISSSVSNQYIYLLFSGKNLSQSPYLSDIIQVLDWNGNKIKELIIPIKVNQIAVSPNDDFLITYHDDGKPNLTLYELE